MTELEAHDALVRANEAARLLGEPLLVNALNAQRADVYHKIESSRWYQRRARESLYQQLVAINNFEAQLKEHINSGKLAKSWLDQFRANKELQRQRKR